MLKIIKLLILFIISCQITTSAVSCVNNRLSNELEGESPTDVEEDIRMKISSITISDELDYAHISIVDGTLSTLRATIRIENQSEEYLLSHGEGYGLEQNIDGVWYEMPLIIEGDIAAIAIAYDVPPMKTSNWSVDWSFHYGKLTTGHYRINKYIKVYKYPADIEDSIDYSNPEGEYWLSAEFDIN